MKSFENFNAENAFSIVKQKIRNEVVVCENQKVKKRLFHKKILKQELKEIVSLEKTKQRFQRLWITEKEKIFYNEIKWAWKDEDIKIVNNLK